MASARTDKELNEIEKDLLLEELQRQLLRAEMTIVTLKSENAAFKTDLAILRSKQAIDKFDREMRREKCGKIIGKIVTRLKRNGEWPY